MAVDSNVNLTIIFNNPNLDEEQQEEELELIYKEKLKGM
jgi:hypothetical protein